MSESRGWRLRTVPLRDSLSGSHTGGTKDLAHLAISDRFVILAASVVGDDPAPEGDGRIIALKFRDFPAAEETAENQGGGITANAQAAMPGNDKKLCHSEIDQLTPVDRRT